MLAGQRNQATGPGCGASYGPVPKVIGNEGRLCQVFLNLVVNAAQAIPEGSADRHEIRLVTRAAPDDRSVMIEVKDTRLGHPRGRAAAASSTPSSPPSRWEWARDWGCSSAMASSRAWAETSPWRASAATARRCRVMLPAAGDGASAEKLAAPAQASSPRRGRVLIVDDEPAVGRALRRILREHDVELATSGRQALERLTTDSSFHVILCDVMMPDLAGRELYEAIQEGGSGLEQRFVFVSGGAFTPGAREFLARVPNPTLEKPFDEAAVKRVVRELVMNQLTAGS